MSNFLNYSFIKKIFFPINVLLVIFKGTNDGKMSLYFSFNFCLYSSSIILLINLYKKDFELLFKYKDDLYDFNSIIS